MDRHYDLMHRDEKEILMEHEKQINERGHKTDNYIGY